MLRRWFPSPWVSFALLITWVLLTQTGDLGQWLLGGFFAWWIPYLTRRLRPYSAAVSRPGAVLRLTGRVMVDIVLSSIAVARLILGSKERQRFSGFMEIPLDMTHPYALASLSCIVTGVPGTVWAGLTDDGKVLTLHVLDLQDEAEWIDIIKNRYESLLMEIFESREPATPVDHRSLES